MEIRVLGSGSSGNAYTVGNGETTLLLDCGLTWRQLQKATNYHISGIDACLISHEHGDHSKCVGGIMRNGIDVYTSAGTAEALGIQNAYRCNSLAAMERRRIGTLDVMALPVEHDAKEPFAYIIRDAAAGEALLYATDTPYIEYNIKGLTHLMAEANYAYENMDSEKNLGLNKRVMKTHMSIDALEAWLKTGEARKTLQQIWLIHLSDDRSNEAEFKRRIQAITGAEVYVA